MSYTHLLVVVVVVLVFLVGRLLQKCLRLRRFKSDRGDIWEDLIRIDCRSSIFDI